MPPSRTTCLVPWSDRTLVAQAGRRFGQQLERNRPLLGSTGMVATGFRLDPFLFERRNTVALTAFGFGAVEGKAGEELGGHTATAATVEVATAPACAGRLR